MNEKYAQEWDLKNNLSTAGMAIVGHIKELINDQIPEYSEFFPFKIGYISNSFGENNFFCLQIKNTNGQVPVCGELGEQRIIDLAKKVYSLNPFPMFEESFEVMKNEGFGFDLFTYIGEKNETKLCWQHITENIVDWLNIIVLPRVLEMNIKRVKDAIPTPPTYDTTSILNNIYVIESESGMLQGTAFHLKGVGLITCDHCIRDENTGELLQDLKLFRGKDITKKFDLTVESFDTTIDVAILKTDEKNLNQGLEIDSTDDLKQMEHIAVAGFPNYNFGDNGIFSPGLIVGFRTHSGIRHILVNTPLISGNSGGPAINKENKVIGIAVTGAEKMSQANETEKHGVIPIDVIRLLKK